MLEVDNRTDFLFPKRNFWTGLSSVIGITPNANKFNASKSDEDADFKAIKSDWNMVGGDIKKSILELINE